MDRFIDCDLSEFRTFVCSYARHNANQHHAIQSVLETIIQSELKSSIYRNEPALDATTLSPQSHASPQLVSDGKPHCDAGPPYTDQNEPTGLRGRARGKDQNKSTGRRRGTKDKPPPIVVSDSAVKLPAAQIGQCPRGRKGSQRTEAGSVFPTSPRASQRTPPTCITDPVPIDDPSAATVGPPRKRRKRGSSAVAVPNNQVEVETTSSPTHAKSRTSVHPDTADEATVEVPAIPPDLLRKLGRVGGIDVLRDLRQTLSHLRSHRSQDSLIPSCVSGAPNTSSSFDRLLSLRTAQIVSMLRNELDITEIGEQLFRFRKRLAQSRFFEFYEMAQKHRELFLQANPETTETLSRNVTSKQAPRAKSQVFNRVVDLMFPDTAHTDEDTGIADGSFGRLQRKRQRDQAAKRVHDWRRNGKPWFALVQRFGEGVLLLLPRSLSDENIRKATAAQLEASLSLMETILSESKGLLRSANALSRSLVKYQAPAEILKLETDNTLMDIGAELSRQDLNALLEPCEVVIPLRESTDYTAPAEQRSDSRASGSSLSPLRRVQVCASRPTHSRNLTRPGTPKAVISVSHSPAKPGLSTMESHLSSPVRLTTPSCFQSTVTSTLSSPAKLLTPTFSQITGASDLSSPVRLHPPVFFSSAVNSNLSSPARLPASAVFSSTFNSNFLPTSVFCHGPLADLRTPSLASPVW